MDISKKKMLIANGCSHTVGCEIEFPKSNSEYDRQHCFSAKIASHFGLGYLNIALAGGSGHRILRTTMMEIFNHLNQGINPKDLFVMIGWPSVIRSEHFFFGEWHRFNTASLVNKGSPEYKLFKYLAVFELGIKRGRTQRLFQTIILHKFLESYGIDHLMFTAAFPYIEEDFYLKNNSIYKKHFPFHVYFNPYNAYLKDYQEKFPERFSEIDHGDEYIHSLFSKKLIKYISEELLCIN